MKPLLDASTFAFALLALGLAPSRAEAGAQDARAGVAPEKQLENQLEKPLETRSFSTPETLAVRALHDRAREHVAARRWTEAVSDLQTILDKHSGELLPAERPTTRDGRPSQHDVNPGAGLRARALLLSLPLEARTAYRARHEVDATAALAAARASQDTRALAEVGRRWPLCDAAVRALVTLCDVEFERGNVDEARVSLARALALHLLDADLRLDSKEAWAEARTRVAAAGDAAVGWLRRIDALLERTRRTDRNETIARRSRWLSLPNLDEAPGPAPGEGGDAWTSSRELPPHPFTKGREALFAVRAGERVYVSTSLRVQALHAYTGELLWDSGEPAGWSEVGSARDDLQLGVDFKLGLVAPAASDDVVVAPLQLPFALLRSDSFNQIKITTPIPERRLFAFDARTGRRLWDHRPPPAWDGESGTFEQRMSVGAPPVLAGSRVLVPLVRMQGRINYQIGCFDLDTGALLWSRDVISGQREQNMFGRAKHEFQAAPLWVGADRIVAITQLGTIAALDLFTGEILWEAQHETIEIPRNRSYDAPEYPSVWRTTPPVVVDGVVLATPVNSRDLVALDLETGAVLWSQSHASINALVRKGGFGVVDLLLGASRTAVYLGGDRLVALDMPSGVAQRSPLRAKWVHGDASSGDARMGRPVLTQDSILVPRSNRRIEVDLETGLERTSVPWPADANGGNVLLGAGEMFVLSANSLRGYFEWDVLVSRARTELATAPDDTTLVLRLARLLDGRGASEWARGASEAARTHYAEARTVLERALAGPADDSKVGLAGVYHRILRGEARVRAALADSAGALVDLRRAREFAPDAAALRDTLAEELAILLEREGSAGAEREALRAARDELERSCAELPFTAEVRADDSAGPLPFGAVFWPAPGGRAPVDALLVDVPTGLWVLIDRAREHARAGDTRGEFADHHALLERWADVELPTGRAGDLSIERMGTLIAGGRAEGFAEYESRAATMLSEAVRAHDDAALVRVARLFPLTSAARSANDARLALALDAGDVTAVARIVESELEDGRDLSAADERDARLVRRLALALAKAGNREAAGALLARLGRTHGETVSDLPDDAGATFAALAAAAPQFARRVRRADVGRFRADPDLAVAQPFVGDYEILGETIEAVPLHEISAGHETAMVCAWNRPGSGAGATTLVALGSNAPENGRWYVDLSNRTVPNGGWRRRVAFAAGRVLVAQNEVVTAFDSESGSQAWQWKPRAVPDSMSITCSSGVAIVVASSRNDRDGWTITALDAQRGAVLWTAAALEGDLQRAPIVSADRVVFVPMSGRDRVEVRDLFMGTRTARFQLETSVTNSAADDAWIEGDRLYLPWFGELRSSERNQILCYDLATGTRVWRLGLDASENQRRWLSGVIQQGARTWLVLQAMTENAPQQGLHLLDTGIGALTPLSSIRMGDEDRVLGMARPGRYVMPEGPVALLSPRTSGNRGSTREARVRCVDLDRGELWAAGLGLGFDDLSPGSSALPALSDTALAIALGAGGGRARGDNATNWVWFFDIRSGQSGGRRDLRRLDGRDVPELVPFGDTLLVRTKAQLEILR